MTGAIKPGARRDAYKGDDTAGALTAEEREALRRSIARLRRWHERPGRSQWTSRGCDRLASRRCRAILALTASPAPPRHRRRPTTRRQLVHGHTTTEHPARTTGPTSRTVRADSGGGVPNTSNTFTRRHRRRRVGVASAGTGATTPTGATSVPRHRRRPPRRQSSGDDGALRTCARGSAQSWRGRTCSPTFATLQECGSARDRARQRTTDIAAVLAELGRPARVLLPQWHVPDSYGATPRSACSTDGRRRVRREPPRRLLRCVRDLPQAATDALAATR